MYRYSSISHSPAAAWLQATIIGLTDHTEIAMTDYLKDKMKCPGLRAGKWIGCSGGISEERRGIQHEGTNWENTKFVLLFINNSNAILEKSNSKPTFVLNKK